MDVVRIEVVSDEWERIGEVDMLLYDVLYRGFGVPENGPWRVNRGSSTLFAGLAPDGRLLGAVRLMASAGVQRQLRQLAVDPEFARRGVGGALVKATERVAKMEGATRMWLNARDTAFAFYEAIGYGFAGPVFVSELTGIPHRRMEKPL